MRLKIPKKNYGVTELYAAVAKTMGYKDLSPLHFDCREINVSLSIQDGIFAYYKENNPDMSETDLKMGVAMLMLSYGPKTDESLADYEVEVSDKFIC